MKYNPEIDYLRAFAVISVILYHFNINIFNLQIISGGFLGVDIFFVISGYLISSIIINDLKNNKFSIINFYERRARRILPTLFVIIIVTFLFSDSMTSLVLKGMQLIEASERFTRPVSTFPGPHS